MGTFKYGTQVGLGNASSYQVSGKPFATTVESSKISFPTVTRWVKIINNHNADVNVGFSAYAVAGGQGKAYFTVKQGTATEPLELKVTDLHFSVTSANITLVAGLTGIDPKTIISNWSGSSGVE
jgi:hypothetical protein